MRKFKTKLRELAIGLTAEDYETHCDLLDAYDFVYDSEGGQKSDELDNILYNIARDECIEVKSDNRLMFTYITLYRCKTEQDVRTSLQLSKGKKIKIH